MLPVKLEAQSLPIMYYEGFLISLWYFWSYGRKKEKKKKRKGKIHTRGPFSLGKILRVMLVTQPYYASLIKKVKKKKRAPHFLVRVQGYTCTFKYQVADSSPLVFFSFLSFPRAARRNSNVFIPVLPEHLLYSLQSSLMFMVSVASERNGIARRFVLYWSLFFEGQGNSLVFHDCDHLVWDRTKPFLVLVLCHWNSRTMQRHVFCSSRCFVSIIMLAIIEEKNSCTLLQDCHDHHCVSLSITRRGTLVVVGKITLT